MSETKSVRHEVEGATASPSRSLIWVSWIAAAWALWYSAYRAMYAFGSTWMLPGTVLNSGQFRLINAVGAAVILAGAVAPIVMLPLWRRPAFRPVLLAVCWLVAVGCTMHALIDGTQRVLSLAGQLQIPVADDQLWLPDQRQADLQDLFFNEPWFLIEGLLFAALAWLNLRGTARRWWFASAAVATAILVVFGMLAATGVTGRLIIG